MSNYNPVKKAREGYKSAKIALAGAALAMVLSGGCTKVEQTP
ncbi:MAG: hypothetical protein ACOCZ6_05825 [Nanoarchaeota archaeon]